MQPTATLCGQLLTIMMRVSQTGFDDPFYQPDCCDERSHMTTSLSGISRADWTEALSCSTSLTQQEAGWTFDAYNGKPLFSTATVNLIRATSCCLIHKAFSFLGLASVSAEYNWMKHQSF